jgi:hypothetical protein
VKFLIVNACIPLSLQSLNCAGMKQITSTGLDSGGETDWNLMPRILEDDFTFVTNNAKDFRKLYAKEPVHPGLLIIVPQVTPEKQRELFNTILEELDPDELIVNEVIEIEIGDGNAIREYIQNGFDSVQRAIDELKILPDGDGLIEIEMPADRKSLVIRDNGAGLAVKTAAATLTRVGASAKSHRRNAGFRSIGRLAGIVFSDTVIFTTKAQGEKEQTTVIFKAKVAPIPWL